jgi:hypothetical protein
MWYPCREGQNLRNCTCVGQLGGVAAQCSRLSILWGNHIVSILIQTRQIPGTKWPWHQMFCQSAWCVQEQLILLYSCVAFLENFSTAAPHRIFHLRHRTNWTPDLCLVSIYDHLCHAYWLVGIWFSLSSGGRSLACVLSRRWKVVHVRMKTA